MSFSQIQQEFMAHIRDPEQVASLPGIEERRMKIYRDLFFNNILGFLSSGFPVLKSILPEPHWTQLARDFFRSHDCRSPYFVDISKEFVEFIANQLPEEQYPFPFLAELVHYEWLELDVSVRKSAELPLWQAGHESGRFKLSPLAELVSYQWPVHQISPEFIPTETSAEPNYFVVHRDGDDEVNFSQINQVTAFLVNQVLTLEISRLQQVQQIMRDALSHLPTEQVDNATQEIVVDMLSKQIFIPY